MYKVDIRRNEKPMLKCLSTISNDSILWHKRIVHASFSTIKNGEDQVYGACQKQLPTCWDGEYSQTLRTDLYGSL